MALDSNSGLQYGRKNGLFLNHRGNQFSWESCVAGVQNLVEPNVSDSIHEEPRFSIMEITAKALDENEEVTPAAVGNTAITNTAPQGTIHSLLESLLLELPDLGPAVESELTQYAKSNTVKQCPCLAKQRLPLLPVDVTNDQGMAFPPHMDRLHRAMLMKVDNERITSTSTSTSTSTKPNDADHLKLISISRVFDIEEDPITAPPSPEPKPPILKTPPEHTEIIIESSSDEGTGSSSEEALPEASLSSGHYDCRRNKMLPKRSDDDSFLIAKSHDQNRASEQDDNDDGDQNIAQKVPANAVDQPKSPLKSILEDDLFPDIDDAELCNDSDLQQVCEVLEQVNALLVSCPKPGPEIDFATTGRTSWRERLGLDKHQNLLQIPVNPASEAELPWVPLPPGAVGNFVDETINTSDPGIAGQTLATGLYANSECKVHIVDMFEDGELEECPETTVTAEPMPPPQPSALSSLIKLRLQQNAAYLAPKFLQSGSLSGRNEATPVLPNTDDPGATSQLVSAFMALRGTKRPRLGPK